MLLLGDFQDYLEAASFIFMACQFSSRSMAAASAADVQRRLLDNVASRTKEAVMSAPRWQPEQRWLCKAHGY